MIQWTFRKIVLIVGLTLATSTLAKQRYSQTVFSFPNKRDFDYRYDQRTNTLELEFRNTHPRELSAIDQYDETVIRKVLIKDQSPVATVVHIHLRDRDVRASIAEAEEPYRVMLDLFDQDFQVPRDAVTGLPLASPETPSVPAAMTEELPRLSENVVPRIPSSQPTQKKLLQPLPTVLHSPAELSHALKDVDPGIGKSWKDFPIYMYRNQISSIIKEKERQLDDKSAIEKALDSADAMADYAGRLFDFGHENRALLAYQQVLQKKSGVFEKDPYHLWKFAEAHLGQANLTLADGYYQLLIEKHPESELSEFSKIRRLDIEALLLIRSGKEKETASLLAKLDQVKPRQSTELMAQKSLRSAFWSSYSRSGTSDRQLMPVLNPQTQNELKAMAPNIESQRTAFLSSTLVLHSMLQADQEWTRETVAYATSYFDRFTGSATEGFRKKLRGEFDDRLYKNFEDKFSRNQHVDIVSDFDVLPKEFQTILQRPKVAWMIAESLTRLGQIERSIRFYAAAAKNTDHLSDRLKANFWLANHSGEVRNDLKSQAQNPERIAQLGEQSRLADRAMEATWVDLSKKDREAFVAEFGATLETQLTSKIALKTPALILLDEYQKQLRTAAPSAGTEAIKNQYSPSARTVFTLSKLAQRFVELGMSKEKQQTIELMQFMKPSDMKEDAAAKKLWAKELTGLAEEYRQDNRTGDAGKLFAFAGSNAEDFEDRAASLYKGGLLLYRSGRREEAIAAFKTCSEDGNNRYYANLCVERLDKLNNQ